MKTKIVEIIKCIAFGDSSYHPPSVPFPDGSIPPRYVEMPENNAKSAIARGAAKPVSKEVAEREMARWADAAKRQAEARRAAAAKKKVEAAPAPQAPEAETKEVKK